MSHLPVAHNAALAPLYGLMFSNLLPMPEYLNHWLYEFVTLMVILDPVATVPLFLAATLGLDRRQSLRVAVYALVIAFLILLFFIALGQPLLEALKLPMASFQMAGSLIFLVLGLQMATGQMGHASPDGSHATKANRIATADSPNLLSRAIYPLATPAIAGGGGILTVVMLTDNHTRSVAEQVATVGVLLACLSVHLVSFVLARGLVRWLGNAGIQIISRVFGLLLTSIAVNGIIIAIQSSFGLAA